METGPPIVFWHWCVSVADGDLDWRNASATSNGPGSRGAGLPSKSVAVVSAKIIEMSGYDRRIADIVGLRGNANGEPTGLVGYESGGASIQRWPQHGQS